MWEEVHSEMKTIGCGFKSTSYLHDTVWNNLKQAVSTRWQESLKSRAAGSDLSKLDNIVMDIVGMQLLVIIIYFEVCGNFNTGCFILMMYLRIPDSFSSFDPWQLSSMNV